MYVCLARDAVHILQLDGQCRKLRTFVDNSPDQGSVVTSVAWNAAEGRFGFSSTTDDGRLKLYDVRSQRCTGEVFVQPGLFDHTYLRGAILCSGVGAVMRIFDPRKLTKPSHSLIEPFLENVNELQTSDESGSQVLG